MDYFKTQTQALHGTHHMVLIADKAGSHQRKVCEKRGIALEYQPRGCPELNPVERFFEELRKDLSNHIFETIEQVEKQLSKTLKKYWQHPNQLVKLCYYSYMRTT
jgi:transposase